MRKSGSSNASTVHLPNGEIRKRRYRKKKSTETTTMKGMESLINENEESSANEQLTKSANRLENIKRCDPPMELTISNEWNGIAKQNKIMGNNSQQSKKAPVPRPRK